MSDWAPFAAPDERAWRELQRRRHIIKMVEDLAQVSRDEGFAICHELLLATADQLRPLLLDVVPVERSPKPVPRAPRRTPRKTG